MSTARISGAFSEALSEDSYLVAQAAFPEERKSIFNQNLAITETQWVMTQYCTGFSSGDSKGEGCCSLLDSLLKKSDQGHSALIIETLREGKYAWYRFDYDTLIPEHYIAKSAASVSCLHKKFNSKKFAWLHRLSSELEEEKSYYEALEFASHKERQKEKELEDLRKAGQLSSEKKEALYKRYKLTPLERAAKKVDEINRYSKKVPNHKKQSWVVSNKFGERLLGLLDREYEEQESTETTTHHFSYLSRNCGILLSMVINRALSLGYTFKLCKKFAEFESLVIKPYVVYLALKEGKGLAYKLILSDPLTPAWVPIEDWIPAEVIDLLLPRKLRFADLKRNFTEEMIEACFPEILKIITENTTLNVNMIEELAEIDTGQFSYVKKFHMGIWYYLIATSYPTAMMLLTEAPIFYRIFEKIVLELQFANTKPYSPALEHISFPATLNHAFNPVFDAALFHFILSMNILLIYAVGKVIDKKYIHPLPGYSCSSVDALISLTSALTTFFVLAFFNRLNLGQNPMVCSWHDKGSVDCYEPGLYSDIKDLVRDPLLQCLYMIAALFANFIISSCLLRFAPSSSQSNMTRELMQWTRKQRETHLADLFLSIIGIPFLGGMVGGSLLQWGSHDKRMSSYFYSHQFPFPALIRCMFYPLGCGLSALFFHLLYSRCFPSLDLRFYYRAAQASGIYLAVLYPIEHISQVYGYDEVVNFLEHSWSTWASWLGQFLTLALATITLVEGLSFVNQVRIQYQKKQALETAMRKQRLPEAEEEPLIKPDSKAQNYATFEDSPLEVKKKSYFAHCFGFFKEKIAQCCPSLPAATRNGIYNVQSR